jgi:hypothetical protein
LIDKELTVINNFLDSDSCNILKNTLRSIVIEDKNTPNIYYADLGFANGIDASKFFETGFFSSGDFEEVDTLLKNTILKIKNKVENFFGEKLDLFHFCYHIILPGGYQELHSDSTDLNGDPTGINGTHEPQEYSALLYLGESNKDYIGGELSFPNQKLRLSNKIGDLVIFRGNHEYPHEVYPVKKGIRDSIVLFFCKTENNKPISITNVVTKK